MAATRDLRSDKKSPADWRGSFLFRLSYKSSGLMPFGLYCVFGGGAATATSDS